MNESTDNSAARGSSRFSLTRTWPERINAQDSNDLLAFWKRENAIPDETIAKARLPQVVFLARDAAGEIAGVCTALAAKPAQLGQPVYFWRCFVAPKHRGTRLVGTLLSKSCDLLGEWAREHDFPCIGILLELENERFAKAGRKAEWIHPHFVYIGKSPRGLDVRIHYFKGARLK